MEQTFTVRIKSDTGYSPGTIRELLADDLGEESSDIVVSNETPSEPRLMAERIAEAVEVLAAMDRLRAEKAYGSKPVDLALEGEFGSDRPLFGRHRAAEDAVARVEAADRKGTWREG